MNTPYDSPDYHAFVRHLRTNDSDLARLIIADWLEEHGEAERAEFIRVQVEIQGRPNDVRNMLVNPDWFAFPAGSRSEFERGYAHYIECPLSWWLDHGPAVCRRHPVCKVRITRAGHMSTMRAVYTEEEASEVGPTVVGTPLDNFRRLRNSRVLETLDHTYKVEYMARLNIDALRWAEAEADRPEPASMVNSPLS